MLTLHCQFRTLREYRFPTVSVTHITECMQKGFFMSDYILPFNKHDDAHNFAQFCIFLNHCYCCNAVAAVPCAQYKDKYINS